MIDTVLGLTLLAGQLELGQRLGRPLWKEAHPWSQLAQALALGGAITMLAALLLSSAGVLSGPPIRACTLLMLLCWLRPLSPALCGQAWSELTPCGRRWGMTLLGLSLVGALAPNTHWDAQVYHYTLPRLYLERGGLYWTQTSVYDGTFHALHLLYAWAMGWGGETSANLLGCAYLLVLSLALGRVAEAEEKGAGPLTALLLCASPLIFLQSYGGLSDLPATAYAALALQSWLQAVHTKQGRDWGLTALWAALSLASKLTAAVALGTLALATLATVRPRKHALLISIGLAGCGCLLALPWMAFNFYHTGYPLYPLGAQWRIGQLSTGGLANSSWKVLLGWGGGPRAWQMALNPLIVPGALLYFVRPGASLRPLSRVIFVSLAALCWLAKSDLRYTMPALAWLAPAAAVGWLAAGRSRPRARNWALACALSCGLVPALLATAVRLPVALGLQAPQDYLRGRLEVNDAYRWLSQQAYRKVLLTDVRCYRCPIPFYLLDQEDQSALADPLDQMSLPGIQRALSHIDGDVVLWNLNILSDVALNPGPSLRSRLGPEPTIFCSGRVRRERLRALYRTTQDAPVLYWQGSSAIVARPARRPETPEQAQ